MELLNRIPSEQVSLNLEWAEVTGFSTKTKGRPQFNIFLQSQTFQFVNIPCYFFLEEPEEVCLSYKNEGLVEWQNLWNFQERRWAENFH
jgi:hypothetical protein